MLSRTQAIEQRVGFDATYLSGLYGRIQYGPGMADPDFSQRG